MTEQKPDALIDMAEGDIREAIRRTAGKIDLTYGALVGELDRRSANRQTSAQLVLSVVSIVIAVVALVVSALR